MIEENAFFILKASTTDNRARLSELVEDQSLFNDPEKCSIAGSELTNPKKRIKSEVSWLLGISDNEISSLLEQLNNHQLTITNIKNIPTLAQLNLYIEILVNSNFVSKEYFTDWLKSFSLRFEDISIQEIKDQINKDRSKAGFPLITVDSDLENCIKEQQRYYKEQINSFLNNFSLDEKVEILTNVAEKLTNIGEEECPIMIVDLINGYELEVQPILSDYFEKIKQLTTSISDWAENFDNSGNGAFIEGLVDKLCNEVRNWDKYAQPIQVVTKSLGLKHDNSEAIGSLIRSISIELFNKYGNLEASKKITELLKSAFAEVARFEELAENDDRQLTNIANQIEQAKREKEQLKKKTYYEGECGLIFKDHIKITGEQIEINDKIIKIEDINGISWCSTTINFSTTYYIYLYTKYGETVFKPNKKVYSASLNALWQTVVIKIVFDIAKECSTGKEYLIDKVRISNDGVYFKKSGLLNLFSGEYIFCPWNEAYISSGNGVFFLCKSRNTYVTVTNGIKNTNVLIALIDIMHQKGLSHLSDLLK